MQLFSHHRILFLMASTLALTALPAPAGDKIVPQRDADGRIIFVNEDTALKPNKNATANAGGRSDVARSDGPIQRVTYVYWSPSKHRWVRVGSTTRAAIAARSAADEVVSELSSGQAAKPGTGEAVSLKPTRGRGKLSANELDAMIDEAATRHNVDANLVSAVVKVESNFNPHAVSNKGAMGLMQLMPRTARDLRVANPLDPQQNVDGGVRYLSKLLQDFNGDLTKSLAAYNAGSMAVVRSGGIPPYRETRNYVRQITDLYWGGTTPGDRKYYTPRFHSAPIRTTRDSEGHLSFSNTE